MAYLRIYDVPLWMARITPLVHSSQLTDLDMLQSRVYPGESLRPCRAFTDLRTPLPAPILVDQQLKEDDEKRHTASSSTMNSMGYTSEMILTHARLHALPEQMDNVKEALGYISPRILEAPHLFNEADVVCVPSYLWTWLAG